MQSSRNLQLSPCATFKLNPRLNCGRKNILSNFVVPLFNCQKLEEVFMPNDLFVMVFCVPVRIPRLQRDDEIRRWLPE